MSEESRRGALIATNPNEALREAVALGCEDYCRQALDNGANPSGKSSMSDAPSLLWECCARAMPECAGALLEAGASISSGWNDFIPLAASCAIGDIPTAKLLLAFGADPWDEERSMVSQALRIQSIFGFGYDPEPVIACAIACADAFPDPERIRARAKECFDFPAVACGLEDISAELDRIDEGAAEARCEHAAK